MFQLFFVIFTIEKVNGETLLRKPQPLSISNTFDPSIHSIYDAVDAWCEDPTTAERTYGHISNWDTSGITDMSALF